MFSWYVCKKSVNAVSLGGVKRTNFLGLVEAQNSSRASYAIKLARMILTILMILKEFVKDIKSSTACREITQEILCEKM